jgi:hypothetical protein
MRRIAQQPRVSSMLGTYRPSQPVARQSAHPGSVLPEHELARVPLGPPLPDAPAVLPQQAQELMALSVALLAPLAAEQRPVSAGPAEAEPRP